MFRPIVIFLGPGMKNISIASLAADSPKSTREKNHLLNPLNYVFLHAHTRKNNNKARPPSHRRRRREKSSPRPPSPPPSPPSPPFLSKHFRCRFVRGQLATFPPPSSEMCRAGGNLEEGACETLTLTLCYPPVSGLLHRRGEDGRPSGRFM